MSTYTLHRGDCLDTLRQMPDNSIDAVVTDPPYGLSSQPDAAEVLRHWLAGDDYVHQGSGFMGKTWDSFVPGPTVWREVFRVLKPGGHALVFAGSRTQDLMGMALRLAGFEIRDTAMWVYGSGFPKSLDVSKAVDARDKDAAKQWDGWGTALKPAYEPIILCRKPLIGTVADSVLTWGTGAINVEGCRVEGESTARVNSAEMGYHGGNLAASYTTGSDLGRWPANILHDGLDKSWARYFYCAKASKSDRNEGCEHLTHATAGEATGGRAEGSDGLNSPRSGAGRTSGAHNHHPTVKPTALMQYLCRLITPPGGTVLDPFAGSGSTGKAAILEGFNAVLCEREAEYLPIIEARCSWAMWQAIGG